MNGIESAHSVPFTHTRRGSPDEAGVAGRLGRMTLDLQPTLVGPTLTLRPLTDADHDALYRAASDPLVWEQHPAERHRAEEFDAFFAESLASRGALVVISDGEVIGSSRYAGLDGATSSVEIGWTFLDRAHWGGATNREMKKLMIEHAFTAVDTVRFRVAPQNLRSQRAVDKLGARRVSTSSGWVHYALTRTDWQG